MTKERDRRRSLPVAAGEEQFLVARQTAKVGDQLFLHDGSMLVAITSHHIAGASSHWLCRLRLATESTQSPTQQLHLLLHQQRHGVHVLLQRTSADVRLQLTQRLLPLAYLCVNVGAK